MLLSLDNQMHTVYWLFLFFMNNWQPIIGWILNSRISVYNRKQYRRRTIPKTITSGPMQLDWTSYSSRIPLVIMEVPRGQLIWLIVILELDSITSSYNHFMFTKSHSSPLSGKHLVIGGFEVISFKLIRPLEDSMRQYFLL